MRNLQVLTPARILFNNSAEEKWRQFLKVNITGLRRYGSIKSATEVEDLRQIPEVEEKWIWRLLGSILSLVSSNRAMKLHEHVDQMHKKLGPIYRDRVGPVSAVFVNSPDDFRKIFRLEGPMPMHFLPEAWGLYNRMRKCPRGLLFMDGEEWLNFRRIMNRVMLVPNPGLTMAGPCEEAARDLVKGWEQFADSGKPVPQLESRLYRWSIEVMLATLTGSSWYTYKSQVDKETQELARILHRIFVLSAKLSLVSAKFAMKLRLPVWQQFCNVADDALKIVRSLVLEMSRLQGDGLLTMMRKEGIVNEADLVRIVTDLVIAAGDTAIELHHSARLVGIILIIFSARVSTNKSVVFNHHVVNLDEIISTAFSTQWSLFLLAKNPMVQEKLYQQIHTLDQKEILADVFIRAIIKEAMRLYPIAPFLTRFLPEDNTIAGYRVRKEELILMSVYSSSRDAKNFPHPNDFLPERWLRSDRGNYEGVANPHGSLPFALGARSCIGRKLAETQMILTLSEVVKKFRIDCANADRVGMILHLISVPSEPIKLQLYRRR